MIARNSRDAFTAVADVRPGGRSPGGSWRNTRRWARRRFRRSWRRPGRRPRCLPVPADDDLVRDLEAALVDNAALDRVRRDPGARRFAAVDESGDSSRARDPHDHARPRRVTSKSSSTPSPRVQAAGDGTRSCGDDPVLRHRRAAAIAGHDGLTRDRWRADFGCGARAGRHRRGAVRRGDAVHAGAELARWRAPPPIAGAGRPRRPVDGARMSGARRSRRPRTPDQTLGYLAPRHRGRGGRCSQPRLSRPARRSHGPCRWRPGRARGGRRRGGGARLVHRGGDADRGGRVGVADQRSAHGRATTSPREPGSAGRWTCRAAGRSVRAGTWTSRSTHGLPTGDGYALQVAVELRAADGRRVASSRCRAGTRDRAPGGEPVRRLSAAARSATGVARAARRSGHAARAPRSASSTSAW